jgi:hypothetical protein
MLEATDRDSDRTMLAALSPVRRETLVATSPALTARKIAPPIIATANERTS